MAKELTEALAAIGARPRILIIKPSSLGDVVHALPVLRRLRAGFPEAYIAWLVAPYCAGVIEGAAGLDEVILFDRRRLASWWRSVVVMGELRALRRRLRDGAFDVVIDLQGLLRSGYLAWQTRAPVRVGFANAREGAPWFYTHRVPVGEGEQHAVDRYLKLAAAMGCGGGPAEFQFRVGDEDRAYVRRLLGEVGRYAVLMPGTNWPTKRWPAERFGELVGPLRERFGLGSVIAGGADAVELAGRIAGAVDLSGKTTLPQLVALLEGAEVVIANDSGPMHIAAALGRPLAAVFGPTNPVRTGPYGREEAVVRVDIPCSPCYSRRCSHTSCMKWLTVEMVMSVVGEQLRRAGGPAAGEGARTTD